MVLLLFGEGILDGYVEATAEYKDLPQGNCSCRCDLGELAVAEALPGWAAAEAVVG